MRLFWLPKRLRDNLQKPWGELITNDRISRKEILNRIEKNSLIVSVGDATTEKLLSLGITPDIQVIDSKEMRVTRSPPSEKYRTELRAHNPSGCLSDESLKVVAEAIGLRKPVRIMIDGEEDLLALPMIATYPPNTKIFYGQPDTGIVVVDGATKKKQALTILNRMNIHL